jgi:hypothetical protein
MQVVELGLVSEGGGAAGMQGDSARAGMHVTWVYGVHKAGLHGACMGLWLGGCIAI